MGETVKIGERGRGGSKGDGQRHCTTFGKTTCWRAGHALARRAARARSLTTIEYDWPEWLMVDHVERVWHVSGRGNPSLMSSFAAFTCAVAGLRMAKTVRDWKWKRGTTEDQHSSPASPSISSSSMLGHTKPRIDRGGDGDRRAD